MKALKGDEIVCGCGRVAGTFRNDVPAGALILPDDFAISIPGVPESGRWLCPDCKKEVARFAGDHWRVISRQGWL
jgi:hypothetical protein